MNELELTTAAFRYSLLVIDYLFEHSTEVKAETLAEYGYPVEDPNELIRVFFGNIRGGVAKEIGLSNSSSQDASTLLNAMRCFTLLQRASKGKTSIYLLHYKPTIEQYKEHRERQGQLERRIAPSKWEQTLQELADLRIRTAKLEDMVLFLQGRLDGHSHSGHNI